MCISPCFHTQNLIIESGALPELKRLLLMREHPEIQCHAAGTFRNLAAEDQSQVLYIRVAGNFKFVDETFANCIAFRRDYPLRVPADPCMCMKFAENFQ